MTASPDPLPETRVDRLMFAPRSHASGLLEVIAHTPRRGSRGALLVARLRESPSSRRGAIAAVRAQNDVTSKVPGELAPPPASRLQTGDVDRTCHEYGLPNYAEIA
jgi:hypothetical protein